MSRFFPRLYGALFLLPFAGYWISYLVGQAVPDPLGNHFLAKLPPGEHALPSSSWLQQAALWAIEHNPLRYRTIQVRNQLLLGTGNLLYPVPVNPGHPEVGLGKDGWLFLLNETPSRRSKEDLREISRQSLKVARMVRGSGRKFYFVIFPDKMSIYPEHSGWTKKWAERYAGRQMLPEIMAQTWEKASDVRDSYISVWQPMLHAKTQSKDPLYYKWDTHWNKAGAVVATRAVINSIQPGLFEENAIHFDRLSEEEGFDLHSLFLLQDDKLKLPAYSIHREKEPSAIAFLKFADPHYAHDSILHSSCSLERVVKGRTVILGDSFTLYAFSMLAPWFEDLTFYNYGAVGTPEFAQSLEDSDTVIWSSVERAATERLLLWNGFYRGYLRRALTPK